MDSVADTVHTQAHAWFARLRAHDCSSQDRAGFTAWHAASPRHAQVYDELEDLWDLTAELAHDDLAVAAAVREARHQDTRSWILRHRWPRVAAAVSVTLTGLWLTILALQDPAAQHYATTVGEQRTLALEDGSQVVLDTDTALEVRYGRHQRSLVLRQGRADFQVHKDPARPFVVQAGAAQVVATGTRFQTRVEGGASQVTLLEGGVVITSQRSTAHASLLPGERMVVDPAGALGDIQRLSDTDLANANGWTSGQLIVKDWPLRALVAEMNRYGRTPLRVGDASLGSLPVSGTFNPTEPDSLARALQYGWPVRVERGHGEIVLYRKKQ